MSYTVGIKVEHAYFAQFIDSSKKKGSLTVTTLKDFQRKAVIPIYIFQENKKKKLTDITITDLPKVKGGSLKIDLRGRIEGKELIITAAVPGKPPITRNVEIPKSRVPQKIAWPIIIFLGLLLAGASIFLGTTTLGKKGGEPPKTEGESALQSREETRKEITEESTKKSNMDETTEATPLDEKSPSQEENSGEAAQKPEPTDTQETEPEETTGITQKESTGKVGGEKILEKSEEEELVESVPEKSLKTEEEPQYTAPSFEIIYFAPNSAVLEPGAKAKLRQLIPKLNTLPRNYALVLQGHTAPYGTEEGRIWLSEERAESVLQFLLDNGMNTSLKVTIEPMGVSQPVTQEPGMQYLNRRVTFKLIPPGN